MSKPEKPTEQPPDLSMGIITSLGAKDFEIIRLTAVNASLIEELEKLKRR